MSDKVDLFAPPTKEELNSLNNDIFAPPSEAELSTITPEVKTSIPEAALSGAVEGLTLSLDDEILGALQAPVASVMSEKPLSLDELLNQYRTARDRRREQKAQIAKDRPGTVLAANLAGGLAPALFTGGSSLLATGAKALAPTTLKGIATVGGIAGLGASEADLTKGEISQAAIDTALGAGTGAILGKVAPKAGKAPVVGAVGGAGIGAASAALDENATAEDMLNRTLTGGLVGAGAGMLAGVPGTIDDLTGISKLIPDKLAKSYQLGKQGDLTGTKEFYNKLKQEGLEPLVQEMAEPITKEKTLLSDDLVEVASIKDDIDNISLELEKLKNQEKNEKLIAKNLKVEIDNAIKDDLIPKQQAAEIQYKEQQDKLSKLKENINSLKKLKEDKKLEFKYNEELKKQQFEQEQLLKQQEVEARNIEEQKIFNQKKDRELLELEANLKLISDMEAERQVTLNDKEFNNLTKEMGDLTQKSTNKIGQIEKEIGSKIDDIYEKSGDVQVDVKELVGDYINTLANFGVDDKITTQIAEKADKITNPKSLRDFKRYINTEIADRFRNDPLAYNQKFATSNLSDKLNDPLIKALSDSELKAEAQELMTLNKQYSRIRNLQENYVNARAASQEATRAGIKDLNLQDTSDITSLIKNYTTAVKTNDIAVAHSNKQKIDLFLKSLEQVDPEFSKQLEQSIADITERSLKVQGFKPNIRSTPVDELLAQKQLELNIPGAKPLTENEQKLVNLSKQYEELKASKPVISKFEKQAFQPSEFDSKEFDATIQQLNDELKQVGSDLKKLNEYKKTLKPAKTPEQEVILKNQQQKIDELANLQLEKQKILVSKKESLNKFSNLEANKNKFFEDFPEGEALLNDLRRITLKTDQYSGDFNTEAKIDRLLVGLKNTLGDEKANQFYTRMKDIADTAKLAGIEDIINDVPNGPSTYALIKAFKNILPRMANIVGYAQNKAKNIVQTKSEALISSIGLDKALQKVATGDDNVSKALNRMLNTIKSIPDKKKQDAALFALMQNPVYRQKLSEEQKK